MLKKYFQDIFKTTKAGNVREENYYPDLKKLLENYAAKRGKEFFITALPKKTEAGNPDFRVLTAKKDLVGYIEAKSPDVENLDIIEESEQLTRYRETFPNVILTNFFEFRRYRNGEPKIIIEEIYNPTLQALCEKSFDKVNRDIEDAISQFREKKSNSYSTCITLCIAALEEFLKVMILKKSDKVDAQVLSKLTNEAMRKGAIPSDFFARQIFSNLESVFIKERKETGQAHSKSNYATERNAKLMLNLTLVFIQHCIENN